MMSISLPFFSAEASEALVKCCSTPVKTIMCKSKLRQRQDSVTCVRSTDTVYRCLKLQMLVSFKRTLGGILRSFLDLLADIAEIAVVN